MQAHKGKKSGGAALCAAATVCFSVGGVCVLKAGAISPLALSGARCAAAAALTGLFCLARGRRLRMNFSVAVGAMAVCLTGFCYVAATRFAGAALAIILQYTSPAFAALWLWLADHRPPGAKKRAAVAVVFAGTALCCAAGAAGGSLPGVAAGLASGVFFAAVFLSGSRPGADPVSASFFGELLSAAVGLPFLFAEQPAAATLCWAGVMGFVQTGLAYLLLAAGLRRTDALSANLICAAEPVLNALWAALIVGQLPGAGVVCGGALVVAGVVLSGFDAPGKRPAAAKKAAARSG